MRYSATTFSLAFFLLCISVLASAAGEDPNAPIDPKHDPRNPLRYIPSVGLAATTIPFYLLVFVGQIWCYTKWGARFMLIMTAGIFTFAIGISLRYVLAGNPYAITVYIFHNLLVLLSPCAFIAANYMILGRLAHSINAEQLLLIPRQRITFVFVTSDVITFVIQAAGGSLPAADRSLMDTGHSIFMVGLIMQFISFVLYTFVFAAFMYKVYRHEPGVWAKGRTRKWYNRWQAMPLASIFRVVEGSQGFEGALRTSEPHFYALDVLPLFFAIAIYVPFWPGRLLGANDGLQDIPYGSNRADEGERFEMLGGA
ncbi:hypothetical protein CVT24_000041 [Panaeolus cyanescens]|uniref:Uncharacterized protein n=1 Tax=Panaeolus cyanescens TaxID=181874 RepID=A0A409W7B8_9AGAR|nr:hypothetical protein CVT24_000041 [Panaeolus cyanescens]